MVYFYKIIIEGNCRLMITLTKSNRSTTHSVYRNSTTLIFISLLLLSCGGGGSSGGGVDIAEETAKAITECGPNLEYTKGSMPIILTNPHGASDQDPSTLIPGVSLRTGRNFNGSNGRFVTIPDTNTDIATDILADRIEAITGERPYVIKARFRRSQIDAARSAPNAVNQPVIGTSRLVNLAYDDPKAKPCYDAFYYAINESITEIRENYGRGFIFDIHSTRRISVNTGVARGTLSIAPLRGESIKELISLFGNSVLDGPNSLFGIIGSRGIITTPMDQSGDDEPCCAGSYVVQRWGGYVNPNYPTRPNNTMDTIMIEIAKTITEAPDLSILTNTMNIVGESIVEYYDIWYND